jgi:hypothetical protein
MNGYGNSILCLKKRKKKKEKRKAMQEKKERNKEIVQYLTDTNSI